MCFPLLTVEPFTASIMVTPNMSKVVQFFGEVTEEAKMDKVEKVLGKVDERLAFKLRERSTLALEREKRYMPKRLRQERQEEIQKLLEANIGNYKYDKPKVIKIFGNDKNLTAPKARKVLGFDVKMDSKKGKKASSPLVMIRHDEMVSCSKRIKTTS